MGKLLGIPQQGQPGELTVSQSGPSRYDRDCLFQLVAGVCELGSQRHGHTQGAGNAWERWKSFLYPEDKLLRSSIRKHVPLLLRAQRERARIASQQSLPSLHLVGLDSYRHCFTGCHSLKDGHTIKNCQYCKKPRVQKLDNRINIYKCLD